MFFFPALMQVPQLGRPHFLTVGVVFSVGNLALVRSCFRDLGCLLLLMVEIVLLVLHTETYIIAGTVDVLKFPTGFCILCFSRVSN